MPWGKQAITRSNIEWDLWHNTGNNNHPVCSTYQSIWDGKCDACMVGCDVSMITKMTRGITSTQAHGHRHKTGMRVKGVILPLVTIWMSLSYCGNRQSCIWYINSLWPVDAIWRHRSRSTLAQVIAWCLTTPSPYLNQCSLLTSGVL